MNGFRCERLYSAIFVQIFAYLFQRRQQRRYPLWSQISGHFLQLIAHRGNGRLLRGTPRLCQKNTTLLRPSVSCGAMRIKARFSSTDSV